MIHSDRKFWALMALVVICGIAFILSPLLIHESQEMQWVETPVWVMCDDDGVETGRVDIGFSDDGTMHWRPHQDEEI